MADPVRDRPAAAHPPGALGAAAAGRGARRPEDRPLQRAPLRGGADRGARPRTALRAADVADHGRPRPAPRDQQHLRPPRRRRGAEGHRRGLPRRAAPLRRAGAVRRRGVQRSCCRRRRPEEALEIAERIRRAVAEPPFDVETSSEPIRATVSIGVAGYPKDAQDPNALIHQADLAVYRAKLQGRNRVLGASSEPLLMPGRPERAARRRPGGEPAPRAARPRPARRCRSRSAATPRHTTTGPRFLQLSTRLALAGRPREHARRRCGRARAPVRQRRRTSSACSPSIALVGVGQALALELDDGSISVSAVGALAGAALFGPRVALAMAVTICVVQWSAQRQPIHHVLFNIGALTLSSLAAAAVFTLGFDGGVGELVTVVAGLARRRRLLRRQHRPALARARRRGPRALVAGLARALPLARAALPRLRLHRRRDRDRVQRRRPLRARRLRRAAAADAQDAGGVPLAHAPERPEAASGGGDDPHPERLARAGQPAAEGALDGGDGEPLGDRRRPRRVHRGPLAARAAARARDRAASSSSRRPSSTCSATRRSSTTSASSRSRTRSCSSPPA